jgi:hypothetical protein
MRVAPENEEALEAWNGVLFDRFLQYRKVVVEEVASHFPGEIAWACLRLRRMLCGDHLLRVRRGGWSLRVAQLTA